jgi:hypothetical protein
MEKYLILMNLHDYALYHIYIYIYIVENEIHTFIEEM